MRTTPIRVENKDRIPVGFVDFNEAAKRLGLSASSLRVYRSRGLGPRYVVVGGWRAAYAVVDIDEYARQQVEALHRDAEERLKRASAPAPKSAP